MNDTEDTGSLLDYELPEIIEYLSDLYLTEDDVQPILYVVFDATTPNEQRKVDLFLRAFNHFTLEELELKLKL